MKKILMLSIIMLCQACGEPTDYEKKEELAEKFYERLMEEKEYCEAEQLAFSRTDPINDNETSNYVFLARLKFWQEKISESSPLCAESLNRKKEEERVFLDKRREDQQRVIDAEIENIRSRVEKEIESLIQKRKRYESLNSISVVVLPGIGLDSMDRKCQATFSVTNNSAVSVKRIYFESHEFNSTNPTMYGGKDDLVIESRFHSVFKPNTTENIPKCLFFYDDEIPSTTQMDIIKLQIELDGQNESVDISNMTQIKEINQKITDLENYLRNKDLEGIYQYFGIRKAVIPVGTSVEEEARIRNAFGSSYQGD